MDTTQGASFDSDSTIAGGDSEQEIQRLLWLQASHYAVHAPTVADRADLVGAELDELVTVVQSIIGMAAGVLRPGGSRID